MHTPTTTFPARRRERPRSQHWLAFAGTLAVLSATGALTAQPDTGDCLWCHDRPMIAGMSPEELSGMVRVSEGRRVLRRTEDIPALYTPSHTLLDSVHAALECVDCHEGITQLPHAQRLAPVMCGRCHREEAEALRRGPHDPEATVDGRQRPRCVDCHGHGHETTSAARPRSHHSAERQVEICARCHDQASEGGVSPTQSYRENVHGHGVLGKGLGASAICSDCHGPHEMLPSTDPRSPLWPSRVPATCGTCHDGIAEVYYTSVHGQHLLQGDDQAATCTSCHSSHGIGGVTEEPFLHRLVEECSHCHLELGRTYLLSYHGKATSLGDTSVAICSSCHGSHDIRPMADARSRVNPNNLIKTCSKCHEEPNENFTQFLAHADYRDPEGHAAVYYTWLVMTTLLLSVLVLFVPHSLLWFVREFGERLRNPTRNHHRRPNERWIQRFRPVHRWTHFLIIISFMGLVATGFPLKYSHTDWAHNLTGFLGGVHAMGLLHRIFAILTFTYAAVHLAFLVHFFLRRCPRSRLRYVFGPNSMVFRWRDITDFFRMLRWFFFLGKKPRFDRWTYFEKFDYWGEMWGILVIGGTGLILWFPTLFTRWLPGWILNCAMVVHSIEALLAASVIFLVHFLNTHLRPDKFPVDMVMLTGQMPESEMQEERGDEYDRLVASGELEARVVPPVSARWLFLGRIAGVLAFLCGLALIALALLTEANQFIAPKS